MNNTIEQQILGYGPLLESLSQEKIILLRDSILQMQALGVSAYAERFIDPQGYSIKICNSEKWQELEQDAKFFADFSEFVAFELLENLKLKNKIITRSSDKTSHKFLQRLEAEKLNSSVIVNEFHKGCINISYFMVDPSCPQKRDVILNNLTAIEAIRKNIQRSLQDLFLSEKIVKNKKVLIDKSSIDLVFNNIPKDQITLHLNHKTVNLTQRELDCLAMLRTGASNQFIASRLHISPSTIKFHLNNLKYKIGVISRNDLIKLSSILPTSSKQTM